MAVYLPPDSGGLSVSAAPDFRILLFTLGVTIVTALVFGLVPALKTTKPDIGKTLKDQAGAVVGGGHGGLRKTLVAAQVARSRRGRPVGRSADARGPTRAAQRPDLPMNGEECL